MKNRMRNTLTTLLISILLPVSVVSAQTPAGKGQPAPQAGSTTITGSGTPARLSKWMGVSGTSSFVLGDSTISEDKFGNVGIGTDAPTAKLTVTGMIQTTLGGYKFPDGTVQTTAATSGLQTVFHDNTLDGDGTPGSPLKLKVPLIITGYAQGYVVEIVNSDTGTGASGLRAKGGSTQMSSSGGDGIYAEGGDNNFIPPGRGGNGVRAKGGNGAVPQTNGGAGVDATGGLGFAAASGGIGVNAQGGGANVLGAGGDGIKAFGGTGNGGGFNGGDGIYAAKGNGLNGATDGLAGRFVGGVEVNGNFNVTGGGTKNFKIDHPLDPENKYLYHAAIESSEVLNVYSGNVTTDESGDATVTLPDWFEAVNSDFRYQLTVVGTFAQAMIAGKIKGNRFTIKTNAPNTEVSWQVTGVRSDAAMRKHPFKVEEDKPERERGSYLVPDAYGQPEERGAEWARDPQMMKQLKQQRTEEGQKANDMRR